MFDLKNTEELSFITLKGDAKFEEKVTCDLEKDMRNKANFHQINLKSQNWDIMMGSFNPKQEKYELKFHRGVMCHKNKE